MKRRFMSVMTVLLLVGAPLITAAQNSQSVWDLTETLKVTDLGLNVKYPSGWVYGAGKDGGIYLADSKADLEAISDGDPATLASGSTIQLIATKTENLKDALGDNETLEGVTDLVAQTRGITEKEQRVNIPVMTRRSLNVFGEDDAKQGWILTFWRQGEYYMGAFLTSPSYDETLRVAFSWGQLMGAITPVDALPLGEQNIVSIPHTQSQLNYPDGWVFKQDNPGVFYELTSDAKNNTNEGLTLHVTELSLADVKMDDTATVDDLVAKIITNLGLEEPVTREEFILLGQPAITIRGALSSGQYVLTTQAIIDGYVLQIAVVGADEEKITAFEPTFIAILQSLHVQKSS